MKPIIGIERSQTQIKMAEIDVSAKPPKLLNFVPVGLTSDNDLDAIKHLKEAAETYHFRGKDVSITEVGALVEHRIIDLPPMSKKNMAQVLNRQIRSSTQEPEGGLAVGYKVVGVKPVSGVDRDEILIVTAPQETTRRLVSLANGAGWKTKLATVAPLALLSLAKLHPDLNSQAPIAFILLDEDLGHLVIGKGDRLLFARDFASPLENSEERVEKFTIEINRSILYFGQRHRESGQISQLLVAGNKEMLPQISSALGAVLDRPVEPFDLSLLLDLSPLGDRAIEFESNSATYSIAIGAALELNQDFAINLLPKDQVKEKGEPTKAMPLIAALLAITIGGLATTHVYLSNLKSKYVKLSSEQLGNLQGFQPKIQEADKVKASRGVYQQQQNFIRGFATSGEWENALNAIASIIPNNVSLISLDITRDSDKWGITLKGQSESSDVGAAFFGVNQFYYNFRQLPFFANATMEPPKVASAFGGVSPEAQSIGITPPDKNTVNFEIRASLTSKPFNLSQLFQQTGGGSEGK